MSVAYPAYLGFWRRAFDFKARRQIKELYVFLMLWSLAWSLITIFEPVFLYQMGIGFSLIALYYAWHYVTYLVLMPLGGKFAARYGYERSLAFSTPILIVYFLLLAKVPETRWLLLVTPVVLSIHKIFFWPAYYANFAVYSREGNSGTEQSWQRLIVYGVGVIGPLAGGLVAATFGFSALFIITAMTLVLAGVPMLRTKEKNIEEDMEYMKPWRIMRWKRTRGMMAATLGWSENLAYVVFWPIWLFMVIGRSDVMGVLVAGSVAAMSVWGFFVGEWSDRAGAKKALKWGAAFVSASYAMRAVAFTPWLAGAADVMGRLANTTMEVPFMARLYRLARSSHEVLVYSIAFEMVLAIAKAGAAVLAAAVFWLLPAQEAFMVTFALAGAVAWLYRLL